MTSLARMVVGSVLLAVPVALFAQFGYGNGWVAVPFWVLVWIGAESWKRVSP